MARPMVLTRLMLAAALPFGASSAFAQSRASDNAVTQAEDAFGFSVGRESIGIYNGGQTRGFSPIAAGNVRVEGLYFDPVAGIQGVLVNSTSIKVGLSAQGYPFAAPSGIFDQRLRRPDAKLGGSLLFNVDSFGGYSAELDASLPITERLGAYVSVNGAATVFPNGTDNNTHTEGLALHWRPTDSVEIIPFWGRFDDYNDESGTYYVPAGSFLGIPARPLRDESPTWADVRFRGENFGLLASAALGKNWVARLGAFRSSIENKQIFSFLMLNQQPDGSAERLLIADPPTDNRSVSGEFRVTHSIADGPRLHVFHASVRRRDSRREFGGSDFVSYGVGPLEERVIEPMPDHFDFGDLTRQHVELTAYGMAYDGRWKDVGEISFSLSRANYRKTSRIPGVVGSVVARSSPWLYNGTAAVIVSKSVSLYAGYARGLEESGTAPFSAANRNEPLETILTQQKDAGVRFALNGNINAVVGVFDLRRPYFGFDSSNVFRKVGSVRSRGAEFSVSGKLTPTLNLLFGGVILKPRVVADDVLGNVGSKPAGLPSHILQFNGNWQTPFAGLQLDLGVSHRGRTPTTTDNLVSLPPRLNVNTGARYGFKLRDLPASLRVQVANILNNNDPNYGGPGLYAPRNVRQAFAFLTVDF